MRGLVVCIAESLAFVLTSRFALCSRFVLNLFNNLCISLIPLPSASINHASAICKSRLPFGDAITGRTIADGFDCARCSGRINDDLSSFIFVSQFAFSTKLCYMIRGGYLMRRSRFIRGRTAIVETERRIVPARISPTLLTIALVRNRRCEIPFDNMRRCMLDLQSHHLQLCDILD